jgi:hypothetical protein
MLIVNFEEKRNNQIVPKLIVVTAEVQTMIVVTVEVQTIIVVTAEALPSIANSHVT